MSRISMKCSTITANQPTVETLNISRTGSIKVNKEEGRSNTKVVKVVIIGMKPQTFKSNHHQDKAKDMEIMMQMIQCMGKFKNTVEVVSELGNLKGLLNRKATLGIITLLNSKINQVQIKDNNLIKEVPHHSNNLIKEEFRLNKMNKEDLRLSNMNKEDLRLSNMSKKDRHLNNTNKVVLLKIIKSLKILLSNFTDNLNNQTILYGK